MSFLKNIFKTINKLILASLLLIVRAYQLFISPLLGPRCRFYPSCSSYCQDALHEHGVATGLLLSVKRLSRCHPGHPGGFDPVPKKSQTNHG